MVSLIPPMIIVGTLSEARSPDGLKGARPMAAFSDGRWVAAYSEPPPPIEWPMTDSRLRSTRSRTALEFVR